MIFLAISLDTALQVFYLPATRHPWYWLGIRSIDKKTFHSLLAAKNSVVLVPGGVSECMLMKQGKIVFMARCNSITFHLHVVCNGFTTAVLSAAKYDECGLLPLPSIFCLKVCFQDGSKACGLADTI